MRKTKFEKIKIKKEERKKKETWVNFSEHSNVPE
jgi:hypothetical protein